MVAEVVEIGARNSIESEARKWLIRMDDDEPLTDAEQRALGEWLGRSRLHWHALERLSRFWREANILIELQCSGRSERAAREQDSRKPWIRITLILAGVAVASLILTYFELS